MSSQALRPLARTVRLSARHSPVSSAPRVASRAPLRQALRRPAQTLSSSNSYITTRTQPFHAACAARGALSPTSPLANPQDDPLAASHVLEPTPLSDQEYHEHSGDYLESLQYDIEEKMEEGSELDVEYSSGVLTIEAPGIGTYVLNKQPPNKQIWLSSPITGPKRYDWVVPTDKQNEKEAYKWGNWIYLRDGSSLTGLLKEELKVELKRLDK